MSEIIGYTKGDLCEPVYRVVHVTDQALKIPIYCVECTGRISAIGGPAFNVVCSYCANSGSEPVSDAGNEAVKEALNYVHVHEGSSSRVIAGFPGVGKSHYCYEHVHERGFAHDSDSSLFSWFSEKGVRQGRNVSFPGNYVEYVNACFGVYTNIFISTHSVVRTAMKDAGLLHYLVYPTRDQKLDYINRYHDRGSHEHLIDLIRDNWDNWLDELENETDVNHIVLEPGQFLSDVLN